MTALLNANTLGRHTNAFITIEHEQVDAILNEYNPYMTLVFVPAENRERGIEEFCYAIVCAPPDKAPHIIRWLTPEHLKKPAEILAWVWEGDVSKHRAVDILDRMDAEAKFEQMLRMRAEADLREEQEDLVVSILKGGRDRKHYYRHDGKVYR